MTVIAWDGKTLAADKRASHGSAFHTTTKLFRLANGDICGICGDTAHAREKIDWLERGANPLDYPASQRDREKYAGVLLVRARDKSLLKYEDTPYPYMIESQFWAIGSGMDFALAAMHLGKTAAEAVAVASALASDCGNGIDTLTLTD